MENLAIMENMVWFARQQWDHFKLVKLGAKPGLGAHLLHTDLDVLSRSGITLLFTAKYHNSVEFEA